MRLGNLLVPIIKRLPDSTVLPILSGPLRGTKWLVKCQNASMWYGTYEKAKLKHFLSFVTPQSVVYDIGANVGYYSLAAARAGAEEVWAFEPVPEIAHTLERHAFLNGFSSLDIRVRNRAISDIAGRFRFAPTKETGYHNNGTGKLDPNGDDEVSTTTIDRFFGTPTLLKIDVEGAELRVLHGGEQTIREHHPVIFLSTHSPKLHEECTALLNDWGYRLTEGEGMKDDELGEIVAVHRR